VVQIVTAARALLEERGPEALSMRNVAAAIGVRAPSLYVHIADKRALEDAIIAAGLREQGERLATQVAAATGDPLLELGRAFRAWAREHPHLYRLITVRDLDRRAPGVAEAEEFAGRPIRALTDGDREASLVLWSFAHGLVILELNHRFPPGTDVDALWQVGLETLRPLIATP
jgi:AcrR family transcriptional regulator